MGVVTDKYQVDDKGHVECDVYVESDGGETGWSAPRPVVVVPTWVVEIRPQRQPLPLQRPRTPRYTL